MKRMITLLLFAFALANPLAAQFRIYNTTQQFHRILSITTSETLYVSFPPIGGKWVPVDSSGGFDLSELSLDCQWTGDAALGVHLLSGNNADSVRVAAATLTRGYEAVGIDENSFTYIAGSDTTWAGNVLDGDYHVYSLTGLFDPSVGLAFFFTMSDSAGGNRNVEFNFRYRR